MDRGHDWMREKASVSLNPSQVENTLVQLGEIWPREAKPLQDVIEQFPLGEAALLHLLAVSSICSARLIRHPDILQWISEPEICLSDRTYGQMSNELHARAGDTPAPQNFREIGR